MFTFTNRLGMKYIADQVGSEPVIVKEVSTGRTMEFFYNIDWLKMAIEEWLAGKSAQEALKYYTADQREFLMTGITPDEWEQMFV